MESFGVAKNKTTTTFISAYDLTWSTNTDKILQHATFGNEACWNVRL